MGAKGHEYEGKAPTVRGEVVIDLKIMREKWLGLKLIVLELR